MMLFDGDGRGWFGTGDYVWSIGGVSTMTDPKDQGLDDEIETTPEPDTADPEDDGPKTEPVPVHPDQIPLESGDEGEVKETDTDG